MSRDLIKADLHMHGPIGLEPYWLEKQGYKRNSILAGIVDTCSDRGIGLCAITSESDVAEIIPRGSVHDRFGYLVETELKDLEKSGAYLMAGKFSDDILVFKPQEEDPSNPPIYLINGQTPIIMEKGNRYDHLVVGANDLPNFTDFDRVIDVCQERGLPQGLEHPIVEAHYGAGLKRAEELVDRCDFVEVFNAQMALPRGLSRIPLVGQFTKKSNELAENFAISKGASGIAVSDAHRIEDAGIACSEFDAKRIDTSRGEAELLSSLKRELKDGTFINHTAHEPLTGWLDWVGKFMWGVKTGAYKR